MKFFLSCIFIAFNVACSSPRSENVTVNPTGNDTIVFRKGIDLVTGVKFTDSVQVLFYKNPDGDPKRYTRFFKNITVTDSSFTHSLLRSLDQPFQEYSQVKDCRSEGKMYLFQQSGNEPLQTIYFSTRCDSCCYVYYINNGMFYYMNISKELTQHLNSLRSKAKEPKPTATR